MEDVFIVSSVRTPLGAFLGGLSQVSAPKLAGVAIKEAVEQSGLSDKSEINAVYVGNVLVGGQGQHPAKQCSLAGELPENIPCTLIDKVCCSSMKALTVGTQSIRCHDEEVCVVAGTENMSLAPRILSKSRIGQKMGDMQLVDLMIKDGLWDAPNDKHMGELTDILASEQNISREDQDRFTIQSFKRAIKAWEDKAHHVVPVKTREADLSTDEVMGKFMEAKIPTLRPCFVKDGSITAANSSALSDGAAAAVIASGSAVKRLGLKPIAKIVAYADAGIDPAKFPLAPVDAANRALAKAGLTKEQVDLWEVNEAFAAVPLMFIKAMKISEETVNVLGGAVALGHPLGCTGLRIVHTLIDSLRYKNKKIGLATLCNGGGGATAVIIELV